MNPATEHYLRQCQALADLLPGRRVDWLQARRRDALARFAHIGFPTRRDEDWRYTSVAPITGGSFRGAGNAPRPDFEGEDGGELQPLDLAQIDGLKSHRLVFIDGQFAAHLSHPIAANAGVTIEPLGRVLDERPELVEQAFGSVTPRNEHGFTALNNAGSQDGVAVILAPGAATELPVEMLFVSRAAGRFNQPRNLIIADEGSRAGLIERHISAVETAPATGRAGERGAGTFTNSATEIVLGDKAEVDYHLVQTQSAAAYHICGVWVRQARGSRFRCRTVTLGGALVRNDLGVELAGEQAHCDLLGLYSVAGTQHVDTHTTVTHAAENCSSRELYKGVLAQRGRAVFHGRIVVRPSAQKTEAAQTNNNLLLSPAAEIDSKPQLEIYADDVKCSHGATVGQLDENALFYLRSRGLDQARARALLTSAFVNDVIGEIEIGDFTLRDALENMLAERLPSNQ